MILIDTLRKAMLRWLAKEIEPKREFPLSDFDRIQYEIRPCDVLLIEGRTRVGSVVRIVTQSAWSHSALYIGRLHDIDNKTLRERIKRFSQDEPEDQLIIESVIGEGIIVSPLSKYRDEHIRICRPKGISRQDAQRVIGYVIQRLGIQYDVRQIFDLARFMFPWSIMPRRWRTSLFKRNPGVSTKESCSSLLTEAFHSVDFPILPVLRKKAESEVELVQRYPKLFTPSDFDYSPFFEIIKYPILELSETAAYRKLPWRTGVFVDDEGTSFPQAVESAENVPIKPLKDEKEVSKEKKKSKGEKTPGASEFFD